MLIIFLTIWLCNQSWFENWFQSHSNQGPNLEISFEKKSEHSDDKIPPQAKTFLGFVKCFSELVKGICETCNSNFFNLVLSIVGIVFSIVQFILFLRFASNN